MITAELRRTYAYPPCSHENVKITPTNMEFCHSVLETGKSFINAQGEQKSRRASIPRKRI
jgi:hypothetical protein